DVVVPASDDGQHTAAGGDELAVAYGGPRVVHRHAWDRRGFVDAADRPAGLRRLRIAAGGDDDRHERIATPRDGRLPQLAARSGREERQQRLVEERQDHLRFGIAEADVELDHLRAV